MEALLEKERKARIENDDDELQKIFSEMIGLCKSVEEFLGLAKVLTIKRGQNRIVIKWMINEPFTRNMEEAGFIEFFDYILRDVT